MSNKSIDKLFQEKFKDFRERPDNEVWNRIEATLNERKKSRYIIPIWWKLGAVAAGLALLFYLMGPFVSNNHELPIITDSEKGKTPPIQKQQESTDPVITDIDNANAIKKEDKESTGIAVPSHTNENINTVVTSAKTIEKGDSGTKKKNKERSYKTSTPIIRPSREKMRLATKEKSDLKNRGDLGEELILPAKKSDGTDHLAQSAPKNQLENSEIQTVKSERSSQGQQNTTNTAKILAVVDTTETTKKKSIFEVLDDTEEPMVPTDSRKQKWSLEPSIAPVYFNAAGEGSSIAPSFVSNSKSGGVSLSYGVLVSYGVGKKWSVRSGIQKVNYGYSTNNISYTSTFGIVSIANIDNINYNTSSENVVVQNQDQGKPIPGMAFDASAKSPTRTGKMLQQFRYLEVPMEVNYALLDKKFGVNLIGGVSSLFLTDNSITLESGGRNTELGEANNINSVNFSANLGFGLNYRLMPKVLLSVEPIFKYQLNTFSNTAGSFQPFSIGVYSGLNFKF